MPGADLYPYLGYDNRTYPAYVDIGTGKMLTPEPGGSYRIRAVDGGVIPPGDGRWGEPASGSGVDEALAALRQKLAAPPEAPQVSTDEPAAPAMTEGA